MPPVAILIYRRPLLVRELLLRIQVAKPRHLWILADGPKKDGGAEEEALCRIAREEAEKGITWDCEVKKVYAAKNLGLKRGVEQGLDALFAEEKEAMILEEDCHPSPDFFPFCAEMLARYRNEPKVAAISGNCFLPKNVPISADYFFSRYLHIWGWATWARTWNSYDSRSWAWPEGGFRTYFSEAKERESHYWNRIYKGVTNGEIRTWDYPWVSHLWKRGWVSITPSQNLVTNRGFGPEATNTRDASVDVGIERVGSLLPPFCGPVGKIQADTALDQMVFRNHFLRTEGRLPLLSRLFRSIRKRWRAV
jgi:hypothetical protein